MADNYLGNRMDDYMAGRLKKPTAPRRLTPTGRRPGTLELAADPAATVWVDSGALLPAGMKLIELLAGGGTRVSYRAESGRAGSEPAVRFGARHYPPSVAAPEATSTVSVTSDSISIDSGRVAIAYRAPGAESAAALAAAFLTDAGRRAARATLTIE